MALAVERSVALMIGHRDEADHRKQDEGRDECYGCSSAAPPVELQLLPAGRHDETSLDPLTKR